MLPAKEIYDNSLSNGFALAAGAMKENEWTALSL